MSVVVVVEVVLLGPEDLPRNTWVLVRPSLDIPTQTLVLETSVFRQQVAYVDDTHRLCLNETGRVLVRTGLYLVQVGRLQLGRYSLHLDRRHCTCPSYRYVRTGDRNCKHLNSLVVPLRTITYTKQPQSFQLLSETVPKKASIYAECIYSQKHDGIRIRVDSTTGWTRGGMQVDLSSLWTPPPGPWYDAELCTHGDEISSSTVVMAHLLAGRMSALRLVLFDIIDPTGTQTTGQRLLRLWSQGLPENHLARYHMVQLRKGPGFHARLEAMAIGSPACEGVVVRNPSAMYDTSGHRDNRNSFKIRLAQWDRLRVSGDQSWI